MRFTGGLPETACGAGSTFKATENLRAMLPGLLKSLSIRSLIDAPCGDFHWMATVDLVGIDYLGCDNNHDHLRLARSRAQPGCQFMYLDILLEKLPAADGVLCRDFLQHLPNDVAMTALANLGSGKWLLATSHTNAVNDDIEEVGQFRPLNLTAPPFCLPPPAFKIDDSGRIIGAWRGPH